MCYMRLVWGTSWKSATELQGSSEHLLSLTVWMDVYPVFLGWKSLPRLNPPLPPDLICVCPQLYHDLKPGHRITFSLPPGLTPGSLCLTCFWGLHTAPPRPVNALCFPSYAGFFFFLASPLNPSHSSDPRHSSDIAGWVTARSPGNSSPGSFGFIALRSKLSCS